MISYKFIFFIILLILCFFLIIHNFYFIENFDFNSNNFIDSNLDDFVIDDSLLFELMLNDKKPSNFLIFETQINGQNKFLSYNSFICDNNLYLKDQADLDNDYQFCLIKKDDHFILSSINFDYVVFDKDQFKIINKKCDSFNDHLNYLAKFYHFKFEKHDNKFVFKLNDQYLSFSDNKFILSDLSNALKFNIYHN